MNVEHVSVRTKRIVLYIIVDSFGGLDWTLCSGIPGRNLVCGRERERERAERELLAYISCLCLYLNL